MKYDPGVSFPPIIAESIFELSRFFKLMLSICGFHFGKLKWFSRSVHCRLFFIRLCIEPSMWCARSLEQLKRALWFTVSVIGSLLMSRLFELKECLVFRSALSPAFYIRSASDFSFLFSEFCLHLLHSNTWAHCAKSKIIQTTLSLLGFSHSCMTFVGNCTPAVMWTCTIPWQIFFIKYI